MTQIKSLYTRFMFWIDVCAPRWLWLLVHCLVGIVLGLVGVTFIAGIVIELMAAASWPLWILIAAAAAGVVYHFTPYLLNYICRCESAA